MVGRDGHVAARNRAPAFEQADLHAALGVHLGYYRRKRGDELEFQLRSAAIGLARCVGRVQPLEHDALALFLPQLFPQSGLLLGREGGFDQPDMGVS